MKIYSCQKNIYNSKEEVFHWINIIGGENGWYYANFLWRLRGLMDKMLGGIGFRKGRSNKEIPVVGEKIDFFKVNEYIPNEKLGLIAEIQTFGKGWMEFIVIELEDGSSLLNLKAIYIPNGWFGKIYWYLVSPLHILVYNGILREIKKRSENPEKFH